MCARPRGGPEDWSPSVSQVSALEVVVIRRFADRRSIEARACMMWCMYLSTIRDDRSLKVAVQFSDETFPAATCVVYLYVFVYARERKWMAVSIDSEDAAGCGMYVWHVTARRKAGISRLQPVPGEDSDLAISAEVPVRMTYLPFADRTTHISYPSLYCCMLR